MMYSFVDALIFTIVIISSFCHQSIAQAQNWSYVESSDDGPSKWGSSFPKCGGQKQSPIAIQSAKPKQMPPFEFKHFDKNSRFEVKTDENNVMVKNKNQDIELSGGGLPGQSYKLSGFHFHWGKTNDKGSEHSINGIVYPLELHMVLLNKKYDTNDAKTSEDGIAVLGVFFKIGKENSALDRLVEIFLSAKRTGRLVPFDTFVLKDLLPADVNDFYRYSGSLTTPPCYETVIWTLFNNTLEVSPRQLEGLRNSSSDKTSVKQNFRPQQALNDREVFRTEKGKGTGDDSKSGHSGADKSTSDSSVCLMVVSVVAVIAAALN